MADASVNAHSCPSCGARFAHRADLAGKRMRCACGHVFTAPEQPPPPPPEDPRQAYDFAPDWTPAGPPSPRATAPPRTDPPRVSPPDASRAVSPPRPPVAAAAVRREVTRLDDTSRGADRARPAAEGSGDAYDFVEDWAPQPAGAGRAAAVPPPPPDDAGADVPAGAAAGPPADDVAHDLPIDAIYPTRRAGRDPAVDDPFAPDVSVVRDVIAPAVMLAAGVALRAVQWHVEGPAAGPAAARGGAIVVQAIAAVALALAGAVVAARWLGVTLGDAALAAAKLAAAAVLAWAAGLLILTVGGHDLPGAVAAAFSVLLVYFCAFAALFPLDPQEAFLTTLIVTALQLGAAMLLLGSHRGG